MLVSAAFGRPLDRDYPAGRGEDIVNKLGALCRETDRPAAAPVSDLKRRAFTVWLAGAGVWRN